MNATKAKELLLPIPKEDFLLGRFSDEEGKCCAVGHLIRLTSKKPNDYSSYNCWDFNDIRYEPVGVFCRDTIRKFIKNKHKETGDLSIVNNKNTINGYNQDNPKDRVIALFDDMIKEGL